MVIAKAVNTACHQFRPVIVRDTGPPAVLHAEDGKQKDQVPEHGNAEPGKAGSRGQMAPAKSDGQQLRGDDPHGGNPHQGLDCVGLRVLSTSDLHGLDAAAFLPSQFDDINAVKHRQDQQRQYAVG